MDHKRFDALACDVATAVSRRRFGGIVFAAGLGTVVGAAALDDVNAKKKRKKKRRQETCMPNCADRTCGSDGCGGTCGTCDDDQVCHGGACCQPDSRSATCAGRCGTWTNNCGEPVECATCPGGQVCLSNGSCAIACTESNVCRTSCGCSGPSIEGEQHCIGSNAQPMGSCTSTADCPPRSHCQDTDGGAACLELCA